MAVRDLLVGESKNTLENLKSSNLPSEPDISYIEQLGVAFDKPSVTGGGLARWAMDKLEGSKEYSVQQLTDLYPDAPQNTFQHPNTKRMADWIYKRAQNDDLFSNINKYRSLDHGSTYNAISNVGYDIVKETSPTDIGLGLIGGGLISGASRMATTALSKGAASSALLRGISFLGQDTTKAIIASELAEGLITLPADFAIRKGLETHTQEKADLMDSLAGTIGGVGMSAGIRVAAKGLAKYVGRNLKRMEPSVRQEFGSALEEELNRMTEAGMDWDKTLSPEKQAVENLKMDDRIKYKAYSALKEGVPGEEGMYAMYEPKSTMSHNGAATPFGQSTFVAQGPEELRAYSASVKQKGQIVQLDPEEFNLLDLDSLDDGDAVATNIKQILADGGIESKDIKDALKKLRTDDDIGEVLEFEVQEYLKSEGYEGVRLTEAHEILDKKFTNKNTFIFDGIEGKSRQIMEQLDGSLGGLPESTLVFNNSSKKFNLEYSDGILSNGKKISLDPHGYFNTDPFYGNPNKILTYTEYFDADQVAEINARVEAGRPSALKKKYQGLTNDLIDYVKQLKVMQEFDEASNLEEVAKRLPQEWEPVMKDILDTEHEIALVEQLMVERGNKERFRSIIEKTVEQQAKEGKAMKVLDDADFEKLTKKMIKQVDDRVGTGKEAQTNAIIERYNSVIEQMKQNNPDIAEEIVKAADFCLRKNTR